MIPPVAQLSMDKNGATTGFPSAYEPSAISAGTHNPTQPPTSPSHTMR
jgi:hypothetical protein